MALFYDPDVVNLVMKPIAMSQLRSHNELTDTEFEDRFKDCTLNPKLFSHEAHIRLAWIHITKYGIKKAEQSFNHQILKYISTLGAQEKYNATVTIAGIKVVYHFIQQSSATDFYVFIEKNKRLVTDFKGLLMSHYRTNIFESAKAKKAFIEAELIPFD